MHTSPHTFLLFGMSGSGKGTQGKLLKEYLENQGRKVLYIETGKRFREFMNTGSFIADKVKTELDQGSLLPVFLPIWIWTEQFINEYTGEEDLILDGLARRPHESPVVHSALDFLGRTNKKVLYIKVSEQAAFERMRSRGRDDDTDEYIKSRIAWFDWQVRPAMSYFHAHDEYNFIEINGEQTIDAIHQSILTNSNLK